MPLVCSVQGCQTPVDNGMRNCPNCGGDLHWYPPIEESEAESIDHEPVPDERMAAPTPASVPSGSEFAVVWPWGEECWLVEPLFIGRVPPAAAALADRLERDFGDVSRMHAELWIDGTNMYVRDLDSANGTFVNGDRIEPYQRHNLDAGAELRFAASLTASVRA